MDQNLPQELNELEMINQRTQGDLFQEYLDRMSQLIVEHKLREAEPRGDLSVVAREHTRAVLRRLDPNHKGFVVAFLSDSGLIRGRWLVGVGQKAPVISLRGVDLRDAEMFGMNLSAAPEANIPSYPVELQGVDLEGADLSNAGLRLIDLSNANLAGANLSGAVLMNAKLGRADLTGVDLSDAFMDYADLRDAKVTDEQLAKCRSLQHATMPDGSKHD